MVLHELDVDLLRAEMIDMACYDPDDDDGDGETDADATPLTTVVPWDTDGGDDDRRRFEGERLLHLTAAEWGVVDSLELGRCPLRGVGSRCLHTPARIPLWEVIAGVPVVCRPSPVLGGTFVIFPDAN